MIRILEKEFVPDPVAQRGGSGCGFDSCGRVVEFTGLLIESEGPVATIGEVCRIESARTDRATLAEVVGFRDENLLLMPLGEVHDIHPGSEVVSTGGPLPLPTGNAVKGRVINGLGNPLDGAGPLAVEHRIGCNPLRIHAVKPHASVQTFQTRIKALDTFAPCGRGERFGIFGASGVGKSTLMGMIARQSEADVNVIALIGAREGEATEFLERHLDAEGRAKSVIVVAGANDPTLVRVKAAFLAAKIAEDFRDAGQHVLLMVDSITRVATAQRDVGLAIGEAAGMRGYTPSALALIPQVLEQPGVSENGSITGVFSVLVEADDRDDPIADLARSIVTGEIVLSRELALQNHYPAIDVPASLSRLNRELLDADQLALTARAREALATYRQHQGLICVGAIRPGTNPGIDDAIRCHIALEGFLRQDVECSGFTTSQSWKLLAEAMTSAQKPSPRPRKSSPRKKK